MNNTGKTWTAVVWTAGCWRCDALKRLFSDPEPQPDLAQGVPGVVWHGGDKTSPRSSAPAPRSVEQIPTQEDESFALYVGIVAAVALFLRLIVLGMGPATDVQASYTPATPIEMQLAQNLADDFRYGVTAYPEGSRYATIEAFRSERGERRPLDGSNLYPDAYHAPGYPAVLAAFIKTGLDLRLLLLLQCLIAVGTTLVAYCVGLQFLGRKAPALLVAGLTALHPALIIAPSALSGGVIAVALLMLGLWALSEREDSHPLLASAGGLSLGVSSLFNPLLLWATPLVALWLMLSGRRLQSLAVAGAMTLGAVAPPALWVYRNTSVNMGTTLTQAPTVERYLGVLGDLEAPTTHSKNRDTALLERLPKTAAFGTDSEAITLFDHMGSETKQVLRKQTNAYLRLSGDRALRTLVGHSGQAAFNRLKLNYTPSGRTSMWLGETTPDTDAPPASETPGAAQIASGWVMANFLLLGGAVFGAVAMLLRHRIHQVMLLAALGLTITAGCITAPSESDRLPAFALQMLIIGGMLSPQRIRMSRREKKSQRSQALLFQRISSAPGPGGPLAPIKPLGGAKDSTLAPPAPIPAPPTGTGQQAIHPMLRGGTSEMNGSPPGPGRLI